jgi:pyridoxamine 5'-phosphate oxidase family protein
VSASGQPDVAPVGYDFDGEYFYISGRNLAATYKYKNVQVNGQVALVVDDLASVQPWRPRGIKIHGRADIVERETGYVGAGAYIQVRPERKWSWGIV